MQWSKARAMYKWHTLTLTTYVHCAARLMLPYVHDAVAQAISLIPLRALGMTGHAYARQAMQESMVLQYVDFEL